MARRGTGRWIPSACRTAWLASAIACGEPGADGEPAVGEVGAPCEQDAECGIDGACIESRCERCGDARAVAGELCVGASVVVEPIAGASRIFAIEEPEGPALLAVRWGDPRIRRLHRDGTGGLSAQWYLAGFDLSAAAVADLDGDGWTDLLVSARYASSSTVVWIDAAGLDFGLAVSLGSGWAGVPAGLPPQGTLPGRMAAVGDDGFRWWLLYEQGYVAAGRSDTGAADEIVAGDFDGDGAMDLVTVARDRISLHRGEGLGFELVGTVAIADRPTNGWSRVGDVDGDGQPELLVRVGLPAEAGLAIVDHDPDDGLRLDATLAIDGTPMDAAAADFDEDGRPELVVATLDAVLGFLRADDGTWSSRVLGFGGGARSVLPFDVDDDGRLDLVVGTAETIEVRYADP